MNREEVAAVYERKLRHEIHHAEDNGHILASSCQGVGPGEFPPAVRSSCIEAAIEGARRELGLPVPERTLYYLHCFTCKWPRELDVFFATSAARALMMRGHEAGHSMGTYEVIV